MPFAPNGMLEITNEKLIFAEPAIAVKTKPVIPGMPSKRLLYANLPTSATPHSITYSYIRGRLAVSSDDTGNLRSAEITNSDGSKEHLLVKKEFVKSEKVLFRRFEHASLELHGASIIHPFLAEVAAFENVGTVVDDMPESGNEIKITHRGYMYLEDLRVSDEVYEKYKQKLFTEEPNKRHVAQAHFGDCFLLASIIGILQCDGGPDFIMGMFKQLDNNHVVVRLYDPRTLEPIYLRVRHSYHSSAIDGSVNHKQAWVHILEKAFVGAGFKNVFDEKTNTVNVKFTHQSFLGAYGDGGFTGLAMTILTGKKYEPIPIKKPLIQNPFEMMDLDNLGTIVQFNQLGKDPEQIKELSEITSSSIMLGEDLELIKKYWQYISSLKTNSKKFIEWQAMCESIMTLKNTPHALIDVAVFEDLFKKIAIFERSNPGLPTFPIEVKQAIFNFVNQPYQEGDKTFYRVPGKLGDAHYTKEQRETFDCIRQAINEGKALAAGTLKKSVKIPGLRADHAYAITGVTEKTVDGKRLCFVTLRNPWNMVGRCYHFDKKDADGNIPVFEEKEISEFHLELSEFYKYVEHAETVEVPYAIRVTNVHRWVQEIEDSAKRIVANEKGDVALRQSKVMALTILSKVDKSMDEQEFLRHLEKWKASDSTFKNNNGKLLTNYELISEHGRTRSKFAASAVKAVSAQLSKSRFFENKTIETDPKSKILIDNICTELTASFKIR